MSRDEIAKLIGGYATGTLTPAEREALFEAALEDQGLFDALAREQSLEDLLRDPAARAYLLAALDDPPLPWHMRAARWVSAHAVGVGALASFLAMAGYVATQVHFSGPRVRLVADAPQTIEVTGEAPSAARRPFDTGSLKRPASVPDLPPPPAAPHPRIGRPSQALLALAVPTAPPPPPPGQDSRPRNFALASASAINGGGGRQNFTVDGVLGPDLGSSTQMSFQPTVPPQDITVAAAAAPVQTAPSNDSKVIEFSQIPNTNGRSLLRFQAAPGASTGRNLLPVNDAVGARALFYEAALPGTSAGAAAGPSPRAQLSDARSGAAAIAGTVVDPGGAVVPNARVQIRDAATGGSRTTVSGPEGTFRFDAVPPARYDLTAVSAGFQTYERKNIEVAADQVRNLGGIKLEVGAVTEAVEVTAAAPLPAPRAEVGRVAVQPGPQRSLAGGGGGGVAGGMLAGAQPATAAPALRTLGVRYQILRRLPNGDYETLLGEALAKGDTIKLRFVPNLPGYLHVAENDGKPLLQTRVQAMGEVTTPAIKIGKTGRSEFLVVFSAGEQPRTSYDAAAVRSAAATMRSETIPQERATYLVSGLPAVPAQFVIALDSK